MLTGMKIAVQHFRVRWGVNSIVEFESEVSHSQQESIVSHLNRQGVIHRGGSGRRPSRMNGSSGAPRKPKALASGSRLGVFAPASPAAAVDMIAGLTELKRHGFQVVANQDSKRKDILPGRLWKG